MSSRLSKIRLVRIYVMIRTVFLVESVCISDEIIDEILCFRIVPTTFLQSELSGANESNSILDTPLFTTEEYIDEENRKEKLLNVNFL